MEITIVYEDESVWTGNEESLDESPKDLGVQVVTIHHPSPEYRFRASGWDHYNFEVGSSLLLVLYKDWESYDRDGSRDPYAGQGQYWLFNPDGTQDRHAYMPIAELPETSIKRYGIWVDDEVARRIGIL